MKKGERYRSGQYILIILDVVTVMMEGREVQAVLYHHEGLPHIYVRPVSKTVHWKPIKGRPDFQVGQVWETLIGRRVKIIAVDDMFGEQCIAYKYPDTGARWMRRVVGTEGWVFVR